MAVLPLEENNRNRKTADAVALADRILDVERASNADRDTAGKESTKGAPDPRRRTLTTQPPEQRDEHPTAQSEKDDDDENAHLCLDRKHGPTALPDNP